METETDKLLVRAGKWTPEFQALRAILGSFELTEQLKWGWPCFAQDNNNIVLIHGFKEYCALLFFKGTLMSDPGRRLSTIGQNTQSGRQMRFTSLDEITADEQLIRAFIAEAIELDRSGLKVEYKPTAEYPVPEEFQCRLDAMPELQAAFNMLTPGRQRAYLLHFAQPKQSSTRTARVEKCIPAILNGKGLAD